jgi:hypothetical protein
MFVAAGNPPWVAYLAAGYGNDMEAAEHFYRRPENYKRIAEIIRSNELVGAGWGPIKLKDRKNARA